MQRQRFGQRVAQFVDVGIHLHRARRAAAAIQVAVRARDALDARERLFERVGSGGVLRAAALEVEQTGDQGEIILHPVVEFLEEQVALGHFAIALGHRIAHRAAEALGDGDDQAVGERVHDQPRPVRRIGEREGVDRRQCEIPGIDDRHRPGDRPRRPAAEQRGDQHRRIAERERPRAGRNRIERRACHRCGGGAQQPEADLGYPGRHHRREPVCQIELAYSRHRRHVGCSRGDKSSKSIK